MPSFKTPSGIVVSGSLVGQMKFALQLATNYSKFGIKVSDIVKEGYSKSYNPYIRSFKTAKEYFGIWKNFANFVKENFGINSLNQIKAEHIEAFIESKAELSVKSLQNISSAFGKLEAIMREKLGMSDVDFGSREDFSGRFLANKIASELENPSVRGAYENPSELISHLKSETHQLVAELQWQGGFRIHEIQGIRESSFVSWTDSSGREHFGVEVKGKGGFERVVELPKETWERAKEHVEEWGRINFKYQEYLSDLRQSALTTGQAYQGSHGLRYCFAQEKYQELINSGWGHNEALKEVSEMLGHHRPEITEHYLSAGGWGGGGW